jgi:hypothetical protein
MLVTTLSAKLLDDYGRSTVATWHAFTKRRIVVVVNPDEVAQFRTVLGSAYSVIPFSDESLQSMAAIRSREEELAYRKGDYRWQAARFSWKVFAMEEAFRAFPEDDPATWLDADSLLKPGFDDWLSQLFSDRHAVSFLGRAHKQLHAETGLIDFRSAKGRELFRKVLEIYRSLEIFDFNEWTDSYIYTYAFQFHKDCFDICKHRGVKSSNPLYEIDRGRHLLHLKGMRKSNSIMLLDNLRVILRR